MAHSGPDAKRLRTSPEPDTAALASGRTAGCSAESSDSVATEGVPAPAATAAAAAGTAAAPPIPRAPLKPGEGKALKEAAKAKRYADGMRVPAAAPPDFDADTLGFNWDEYGAAVKVLAALHGRADVYGFKCLRQLRMAVQPLVEVNQSKVRSVWSTHASLFVFFCVCRSLARWARGPCRGGRRCARTPPLHPTSLAPPPHPSPPSTSPLARPPPTPPRSLADVRRSARGGHV
jgi:hypothetical protein